MQRFILFIIAILFTGTVCAAELPTSDEVKKVLDFYYHGQGLGVVLVESKFCRDIQREGDEKNECSGEITAAEPLNKGDEVYLWMAYMVPTGDEKQKIIVQFDNGGVTRMVRNLEISGSLRYRTWRKVVFDRTGQWTAKIVHDQESGAKELGQISVNVQ
jgi:hypothetical protein